MPRLAAILVSAFTVMAAFGLGIYVGMAWSRLERQVTIPQPAKPPLGDDGGAHGLKGYRK